MAIFALALTAVVAVASSPLDPSFGRDGIVLAPQSRNEGARALAEDARHRLVVAGSTRGGALAIRRYLGDGRVDRAFGRGGETVTELESEASAEAMLVLPDGKILVGGGTLTALTLLRYLDDGTEDRGFGRNGHVLVPAGTKGAGLLALDRGRGGRVLAGGYRRGLNGRWTGLALRFRQDGTLDPSFGNGGKVRFHAAGDFPVSVSGIAELPGGRVLVGGDSGGSLLLARLLADGRPDPSFGGGDGKVLVDVDRSRLCGCSFANGLAVDGRGRPVLGGVVTGPGPETAMVARFQPDGRIDRTFGRRGIALARHGSTSAINAIALQPGGRIAAAGYGVRKDSGETQAIVLRFLSNGALDRAFGRGGFFGVDLGSESVAYAALGQRDGRVVVAGRANVRRPQFEELGSPLDGAQFMLMRLPAAH
jgi:uncharacterized delta-60 repeat protein